MAAAAQEVGGGGGIPLHHHLTGGAVALVAANHKALMAVVFHLHAKQFHAVQGDIDIGFGDQLAFDLDAQIALRQGSRHQQGGEKLTGDIAADADGAAGQTIGIDLQRRESLLPQVADAGAQRAQGVHQIADRALVHARLAGQVESALAQAEGGGERAHGGAGVAQEQIRRGRLEGATHPLDRTAAPVLRQPVADPQLRQGVEHVAHIVAVEQVGDAGLPLGQCRQQQNAVGKALGAGQLHLT